MATMTRDFDVSTKKEPQHSKWSAWINQKFDEYRTGRRGADATVTAFAREFDATHSVILGWLRIGSTPPRKAAFINRLVEMYGDEAYEALGLSKLAAIPDHDEKGRALSEDEKKALDLFNQAPDGVKQDFLDQMELYLFRHGFTRTK